MDPLTIYAIAIAISFLLACGVGANDVANAMGTSVGSRALTIRQAVLVAAVFEASGAFFAGGQVTETFRTGIIDIDQFDDSQQLVIGMLACSLASGIWLLLASYFGWPVSTTHSILGALMGFGMLEMGFSSLHWGMVGSIFISWMVTPLFSALFAFAIFKSVQIKILDTDDPLEYAKKYVPVYIFLTASIVLLFTMTKGLKHVGLTFNFYQSALIAFVVALIIAVITAIPIRKIEAQGGLKNDFRRVELVFGVLMIFTACAMAFAHGSNDVANAIGPLALIVDIIHGAHHKTGGVHLWVLGLGAVGIVCGLAVYGYKVIMTIGQNITELTPSRGFAAELAAATTVVSASYFGIPVSTTHALVGAILGVGLARGIAAINLNVIRSIMISWAITLPMGAMLTIICYFLMTKITAM